MFWGILLPPLSGEMKRSYSYTILHDFTSHKTDIHTNVLGTVLFYMFCYLAPLYQLLVFCSFMDVYDRDRWLRDYVLSYLMLCFLKFYTFNCICLLAIVITMKE
jgi:hypothetical protein